VCGARHRLVGRSVGDISLLRISDFATSKVQNNKEEKKQTWRRRRRSRRRRRRGKKESTGCSSLGDN